MISYWRKRVMCNNIVFCKLRQNSLKIIAAISGLYNLTVKDIIHLPVSRLNDIIWFKFITLWS